MSLPSPNQRNARPVREGIFAKISAVVGVVTLLWGFYIFVFPRIPSVPAKSWLPQNAGSKEADDRATAGVQLKPVKLKPPKWYSFARWSSKRGLPFSAGKSKSRLPEIVDTDRNLRYGIALLDRKDAATAKNVFQTMIVHDPNSIPALQGLAEACRIQLGKDWQHEIQPDGNNLAQFLKILVRLRDLYQQGNPQVADTSRVLKSVNDAIYEVQCLINKENLKER